MKTIPATLLLAVFSAAFASFSQAAPKPTTPAIPPLSYDHPADATKWHTEGLPVGNGRLGAMLFGGTVSERIQFNENTLWGGTNNWDGDYDTSDKGFGGYRNFGDLWIDWGNASAPVLSSPSGHGAGNGQGIDHTVGNDPDAKWCIENPGESVIWQAELPKPTRVENYRLTSAGDVPERDPQTWIFEGSSDGKTWVELDKRALNAPFEKRGMEKQFALAKAGAYRFYRLVFTPPAGASHFQVSKIVLDGVTFASGAAEHVPKDYRMTLDLNEGIHRVVFTDAQGAKVSREAFASRPDQVIVFRYTADKKGAFSGKIRLKSAQGAETKVKAGIQGTPINAFLSCEGQLVNALRYAAGVVVRHDGGQMDIEGDALVFTGCDALTLLLNARTDYKPSYAEGWRGAAPMPQVMEEIERAAGKSHADLRAAHLADFTKLMDACQVDFGQSPPQTATLTTIERLRRYTDDGNFRQPAADPELEAQLFQMGRYLLVSSSRPGSLPANLQGLWNDSNSPAWASDYHNNINLQMNYWPAEATGLGECAVPLMDFIVAQAPACRIATQRAFGDKVRGWTARTSQSPLGGNAWDWNIPASAWYALHVYDHWDFSRDEKFLRETAHPVLREICEYWEDRLKLLPDGTLVAPDGWSPEHGPREDGVMHDQQLIWELFDDYLKVAAALGVDEDYRKQIAGMQAKLAPNKIGKWGQLQEWQADRDDPNNRHRHTSHLFALFPGRQISKTGTPELARAAKVSLLARSNDSSDKTGKPWTPADMHPESIYNWVWPWRAAMWARLGEGDRAHALLRGKAGNTGPNGLSLNVPYFKHRQELIQLDGAFGATAAAAEMLMQSHAGEIQLLPALPKVWAERGAFRGMRARGGFIVDCTWKDGAIVSTTIAGKPGSGTIVRSGGREADIVLPPLGSHRAGFRPTGEMTPISFPGKTLKKTRHERGQQTGSVLELIKGILTIDGCCIAKSLPNAWFGSKMSA